MPLRCVSGRYSLPPFQFDGCRFAKLGWTEQVNGAFTDGLVLGLRNSVQGCVTQVKVARGTEDQSVLLER